MALSRKPTVESGPAAPVVDVDALIRKGGSVAGTSSSDASAVENAQNGTAAAEKSKSPTPVVLRIPGGLLARIDSALEDRAVKIPRHTWLLEALVEKLDREQQQR